jgi:hypothetical protein
MFFCGYWWVSTVGCNAFLCKNNISKSKDKTYYLETYKEFDNEKDFLEQYSPGNGGIAPFPSYMYCTNHREPCNTSKYLEAKQLNHIST